MNSGAIGSKRKTIAIYKELIDEGMEPRLFERASAPVGIEIGAVTPEEIEVAIVAGLIAVKRGSDADLARKRLGDKSEAASSGS